MLSLSHHIYQDKKMKCKWIHEDGTQQGSPIMVYMGVFGEVVIKHVLASAIKKGGPLEEIKIVIIQLKWNAQGKGIILIGFPFYRSHSWETGLQDRRRTIKRGSQVSNLIASLWGAQTFAFLAYHLSWFLFGFYQYENLELVFISIPSSSSPKTDFVLTTCCVFGFGGFAGSSFYREVLPLYI